ncbi:MAG TPA: NlpC/P60 family protein [Dehalococcoidia bacterium]|jgi:hypothetical protein
MLAGQLGLNPPAGISSDPLSALSALFGQNDPLGRGSGTSSLGAMSPQLAQAIARSKSPSLVPTKQAARAIAWAQSHLGQQDWNNLCERFVEEAYGTKNVFPTAAEAGRALATHRGRTSWQEAPVGALLYFAADATNDYNGHAGIYLGNGRMISATPRGVQEERLETPYYAERFLGWAEPTALTSNSASPRTTAPRGSPTVPSLPARSPARPVTHVANPIPPTLASGLLQTRPARIPTASTLPLAHTVTSSAPPRLAATPSPVAPSVVSTTLRANDGAPGRAPLAPLPVGRSEHSSPPRMPGASAPGYV